MVFLSGMVLTSNFARPIICLDRAQFLSDLASSFVERTRHFVNPLDPELAVRPQNQIFVRKGIRGQTVSPVSPGIVLGGCR